MKQVPPILKEFIDRVLTENPKFFKYIELVSYLVALIAFLPDVLSFLEVPIPSFLETLHDKAIKVGAITAALMARLPNKTNEPKA